MTSQKVNEVDTVLPETHEKIYTAMITALQEEWEKHHRGIVKQYFDNPQRSKTPLKSGKTKPDKEFITQLETNKTVRFLYFTLACVRVLGVPVRSQITDSLNIPKFNEIHNNGKELPVSRLIISETGNYELLIMNDKVGNKKKCVSLPLPDFVQLLLHVVVNHVYYTLKHVKLFPGCTNKKLMLYITDILGVNIPSDRSHFFRSLKANIYGLYVKYHEKKMEQLAMFMRHNPKTRQLYYTPLSHLGRLQALDFILPTLTTGVELMQKFKNDLAKKIKQYEETIKKKYFYPSEPLKNSAAAKSQQPTQSIILKKILVIQSKVDQAERYDYATIDQSGRLFFALGQPLPHMPNSVQTSTLVYTPRQFGKGIDFGVPVEGEAFGVYELDRSTCWNDCVNLDEKRLDLVKLQALEDVFLLEKIWDDLVPYLIPDGIIDPRLSKLKAFFMRCLHRNAVFMPDTQRVVFPVTPFRPVYAQVQLRDEDWYVRKSNSLKDRWELITGVANLHRYVLAAGSIDLMDKVNLYLKTKEILAARVRVVESGENKDVLVDLHILKTGAVNRRWGTQVRKKDAAHVITLASLAEKIPLNRKTSIYRVPKDSPVWKSDVAQKKAFLQAYSNEKA
jgi:hypothetical protein